MKFYSTNRKSPVVSLSEAVLHGLAPDGGLYMPVELPILSPKFFSTLRSISFPEIAYQVAWALMGDEVPPRTLQAITEEAFNFPVPLVRLAEHRYVLELFHGPTLAFKDFGARFMACLMSYFVRHAGRQLTVLVATSGDTGSAVAKGFLNVPGIRVVVLYPSGQVSEVQEKQLATIGGNIIAVEVEGSFDDCQRLVKQAFVDPELRTRLWLTSANSINIARLLPQSFYYFHAYARLDSNDAPVVFSVPSGNFGNLTAGLLAKRMGLPVAKFIAATNINDTVPKYLETGIFEPRPSQKTITNAMDVGNPSNFARMLELYNHLPERMREDVSGSSHSDQETERAIRSAYQRYGYLFDPHGAVGFLGLEGYARQESTFCQGIVLVTAHPAKFAPIVERAARTIIPVPPQVREVLTREKNAIFLSSDFQQLKAFLLSRRD